MFGDLRAYNPWIDFSCDNLQTATWVHGHTLCLSPQAGIFNSTDPVPGVIIRPAPKPGYTMVVTPPPEEGAVVADGTTLNCGKWYTVTDEEESCVKICTATGITIGLFEEVNPSFVGGESEETCADLLRVGSTYCVGPIWGWDTI